MSNCITSIENFCMGFVKEFQDKLTWEWDGRFEAALATCKTDDKDAIHLSLQVFMKTIWDNSNAEDAPDVVLDVISHFGGLMPGQLLFISDLDQGVFLCCAWWPWGDGETVSIRLAPYAQKKSDGDAPEFAERFRGWFGV